MAIFKYDFFNTPILLFICGIFLLLSCTPQVEVQRLKPAQVNLSSYPKIALGKIEGKGGDQIAGKLTQNLAESEYFQVVERKHLKSILKEQDLSISEVSNPNNAVKLGKLLTGSAMLFGEVYTRNYRQNISRDKRTCTNDDGEEYRCYSYTLSSNWNLNTNLKLVDTSTGKVLASKTFEKSETRSSSETGELPQVNWNKVHVFAQLEDEIVQEFMQVISPHKVSLDVYMYKDSKALNLFGNIQLPQLKTGIKYAKQGDWQSAIEKFQSAVNKAERDPSVSADLRAKAHYNLGIAFGYSGKYNKGLKQIEKAINIKPQDVFFKQKTKIKQFIEDEKKLKQQGVYSPFPNP